MIQQLDWDMTRIGRQGQKARNRAVTKLTCLGKREEETRQRVLETAGRLLGHSNIIVNEAAMNVFQNLDAVQEMNDYKQKFLLRYGSPQNRNEVKEIFHEIFTREDEGLEVIKEFYPDRDDVIYLNELSDLYNDHTGQRLKIRLRTFSLKYPDRQERDNISHIQAEVIEDFHVSEMVPTDPACKPL
ncbi:MAG: hypothetical protein HYW47_04945 [Deltaproteobacteria bacterium]|nr:hypothetical protein [Deltaproteobacteria bacterium]